MTTDSLVQALRQVRLEQQLTQSQVAERMGCSERFIRSIEAGTTDPKLSTLDRYANAVDHTIRTRLWPKDM